ncbi:MAG TPA: hypothetical protein VE291_10770 [Terracidiphilus sp.]|jgi:hypothetical protein|nr:hypothetical protein [Terracidiphilus sp.]
MNRFFPLAALAAALLLSGCRSYRIDATVENRTGTDLELLEVDYPSASFGADKLPSGADYRYRLEVRGTGPVKVQYTVHATQTMHQASGPALADKETGAIEIVLLPGGVIQFHPQLSQQR